MSDNAPVRTQPANEPADAQDRPTDNSKLNTDNSPVTYLDILNYNLAQLIRSETAEGHTITEFLLETVTGRDSAFTPNKYKIKPDDRMTAAREVINRGFGRFGQQAASSSTTQKRQTTTTSCTQTSPRD